MSDALYRMLTVERFQRLDAVAVPMAESDINTDQIIPSRFLHKSRSDDLGQYLFRDLRFAEDGSPKQGFILNKARYHDARILVAERNFGCGSSREHAVYALYDYGFRSVIAPSFGDIFFNNCFKNGMLPIPLSPAVVAKLQRQLHEEPGAHISVDLERQRVVDPDYQDYPFEIDPFRKRCLLQGIDEIDFTLGHRDAIAAFENRYDERMSWL